MALPLPRIALGLMLGVAAAGASVTLPLSGMAQSCDWASYPDFCIPFYPPDLSCENIGTGGFTVNSPDPHFLDDDFDGIGCEF